MKSIVDSALVKETKKEEKKWWSKTAKIGMPKIGRRQAKFWASIVCLFATPIAQVQKNGPTNTYIHTYIHRSDDDKRLLLPPGSSLC